MPLPLIKYLSCTVLLGCTLLLSCTQQPTNNRPVQSAATPAAKPLLPAHDLPPNWSKDTLLSAWPALKNNCGAIQHTDPAWMRACRAAEQLPSVDYDSLHSYFSTHFTFEKLPGEGLLTGYYEPLLPASLRQTAHFRYPLHRLPDDRRTKNLPRSTQANPEALRRHALVWLNNPVDVAYVHIQGSSLLQLEDGSRIRVGYAGDNGHPFKSFVQTLLDRNELPKDQASQAGMRRWAKAHPDKILAVLARNPRYIYFKKNPATQGPSGAMGVPLTAGRSIAVDRQHLPLGSALFIDSASAQHQLQRLVFAQDTGSAIRGPLRADFFYGSGEQAGKRASVTKQPLQAWRLRPR